MKIARNFLKTVGGRTHPRETYGAGYVPQNQFFANISRKWDVRVAVCRQKFFLWCDILRRNSSLKNFRRVELVASTDCRSLVLWRTRGLRTCHEDDTWLNVFTNISLKWALRKRAVLTKKLILVSIFSNRFWRNRFSSWEMMVQKFFGSLSSFPNFFLQFTSAQRASQRT